MKPARRSKRLGRRNQTDSLREPLEVRCSRLLARMAQTGAILVASRPQMPRRVPSVGPFVGTAGRFMSWFVSQAPSLTNGQICQRALSRSASVDETTLKEETI